MTIHTQDLREFLNLISEPSDCRDYCPAWTLCNKYIEENFDGYSMPDCEEILKEWADANN